jgi:two-component system response regulator GlrR
VLVVDDDPDILKLLGMCLAAEACEVREALAPADALEKLTGVDVVVVDQRMPTMSGTEFIAAARARGHTCRFLMISGQRRAREEAAQAGADAFLAKPLGARELMAEVERLFHLGLGNTEGPAASARPSTRNVMATTGAGVRR